ncbi:MAG: putative amino-acid ABC transporter-binding protein YhdW [Chroococcopsis gigantea SAG 12.99]|jgi:general L-amino acid transport system substrate-binding protein|nr:amino acid ABC transporter substrate-binding protein [Chlorogloea purpurea SAG 13.99]MDV3001323.1 putative amino-acid ABC transporter-binding protein YhdW [Chroococcopsis gigantea SAG 12.99]
MKKLSLAIISALSLILVSCGDESTRKTDTTTPISNRLETVKTRGKVICGINGEVPGFSFVDQKGEYSGMDVDLCRAVAAALFDDPSKVEYRKVSAQERFTAVQTGEIDILSRNTTLTLSRNTSIGMDFAPPIFYDGQGIMTTKASGIKTLTDLKGKSICVLSGTTTEQNLADQMAKVGVKDYQPVVSDDVDALYTAYQQGRCSAVTSDRSQLVARRSVLPKPDAHQVLDILLSKEPLAAAVAKGDAPWHDAVTWIVYSLIQGEEFGITSKNIASFANTTDPSIKRFLGKEDKLGADMGLPADFAARVIKHVGNYGEMYDRNIGQPLKLERGINNLSTKGGILYSPPFR